MGEGFDGAGGEKELEIQSRNKADLGGEGCPPPIPLILVPWAAAQKIYPALKRERLSAKSEPCQKNEICSVASPWIVRGVDGKRWSYDFKIALNRRAEANEKKRSVGN